MLARKLAAPFVFATLVPLAFACTEGDLPTNPVARFTLAGDAAPQFLDVPFPTDLYLDGTHVVDPIPGVDRVVKQNSNFITHEIAKENGFSRVATALFYVDDPTAAPDPDTGETPTAIVDPTSLPADETACTSDTSSVYVVDLAATDPSKARIPCRALFHYEDPNASLSSTRGLVAVGPARGIVLQENHAYATVLTSRVKDTKGRALTSSNGFAAMANGPRTGKAGALYGNALDTAKKLLASALADGTAIVSIAPFTTNHQSGELFQARSVVDAAPVPTFKFDATSLAPMGAVKFAAVPAGGTLPAGFTASLDDYFGVVATTAKLDDGTDDPDERLPVRAHDKIAVVATAEFDAINFLSHPGDYVDLDGTTFVKDTSGNIVPAPDAPTAKIWATIALPTAPMPASGYPVVIVQHGLGGFREYAFSLANAFCKMGWAVVAIDSFPFGSRAPEPKYQVDAESDYSKSPGAKYNGPDGIGDAVQGSRNGAFDMFGGLKNLGALRDQLRQAALDTVQLVRTIRGPSDLSPLATGSTIPKFDGDRIAYIGDSLGGIEGAVAASIEPSVKAWFLNVAGGGMLEELATHAPSIGMSLSAAGGLYFSFSGDTFDEGHPLISLGQTLVDPGDPLTFAGFLVTSPQPIGGASTSPRNILQTEVVYDEIVANEANEALARAGGYGFAVPNVGSNSGVLDMKDLTKRVGAVTLPDVQPDAAGAIHDTPTAGHTAVVVQVSPATHGEDLVASTAKRSYVAPFTHPFVSLDNDKTYTVRTSYRSLQAAADTFFADAFAGQVPRVSGFAAPVRDLDDDGAADDVDADPNDPHLK
ncbi:MAG TPA: hypothetical protein VF407_03475 [Polyangiaceae bacterium]